MKKNFAIILCVMLSVLPALAQTKATADQVLAQAVSKISGAKGVTAQFSLSGSGISGSGTIKAQGGKFSVTMPGIQVWYNGKDLYTYNKKTSETTLVKPTAQELAEANPLAYVGNASKN